MFISMGTYVLSSLIVSELTEYIMIPIRREMNREPIADAIATT